MNDNQHLPPAPPLPTVVLGAVLCAWITFLIGCLAVWG